MHTCPGGDRDSTHSAEVDYADLLPSLFELRAGSFYIALAGEKDRQRVLKMIRQYLRPEQRAFVGVVSLEQLGTTDDCGFSPFSDDTSTTRETAFAKVRARVQGTELAEKVLGDR